MSNRNSTSEEIKKRKKAIQAELDQIQEDIDDSVNNIRSQVVSNFSPKALIDKYPLQAIGIVSALGFLIGIKPKRRRKSSNVGIISNKDGFGSVLSSEVKRLIARKAIAYAEDFLDEKLKAKSAKDS